MVNADREKRSGAVHLALESHIFMTSDNRGLQSGRISTEAVAAS